MTIEAGTWPVFLELDPRGLLVDPEFNIRGIRLDKGFVASIKARGVLQWIVAVRTAEGTVRVRLGNRRTLGAIQADRPTVPVVIIGDESTDDTGHIDRIIDQYSENKHRDNMTDAEEIDAMVQLTAFGMPAAKIAKQLGLKNGGTVKNALKVNGSDLAKAAMQRYDLDLTEALAVAEFEDKPEAVTALMVARKNGQFDHKVQELRDVRDREQRQQDFIDTITASGVPLVDEDDGYPIEDLSNADETPLTAEAHAQCPGHAAHLIHRRGQIDPATGFPPIEDDDEDDDEEPIRTEWAEYVDVVWMCTDVAAQGHLLPLETRQEQAFIDRIRADGLPLVEEGTGTRLDQLTDSEGIDLTPENHAECPGHAATFARTYGPVDRATGRPVTEADEPDEDAAPVERQWRDHLIIRWVCTDAPHYGHMDRPRPVYSPSGPRLKLAEMEPEAAEAARAEARDVRTYNELWRSAEKVRNNWLGTYLTRKTPPKGTATFISTAMAIDGDTVTKIGGHHLAAKLLGCAGPSGYGRSAAIAALIEKASEPRAQVITLAMVLAGYEDQTSDRSWRSVAASTKRYLEFLETCGYPLSNAERRACGRAILPETEPAES